MLINHRKILKNLIRVDKRTMFTTRNVANKAVNMNLIRHGSQSGVNGLRTETALNRVLCKINKVTWLHLLRIKSKVMLLKT